MRTLTLPGVLPDTRVQLMLDDAAQELRAALIYPGSVYVVVWAAAKLADVHVETDGNIAFIGTIDLWLGRTSVALPIAHRAQVEAFITPEPAHAP